MDTQPLLPTILAPTTPKPYLKISSRYSIVNARVAGISGFHTTYNESGEGSAVGLLGAVTRDVLDMLSRTSLSQQEWNDALKQHIEWLSMLSYRASAEETP
jgi:hypothetical protein